MTGLRNHDNWIHGNTGDQKPQHEGAGDHSCDMCDKVNQEIPEKEYLLFRNKLTDIGH